MTAYKAAMGNSIQKRIDTGTKIIDGSNVMEFYNEENELIEKMN